MAYKPRIFSQDLLDGGVRGKFYVDSCQPDTIYLVKDLKFKPASGVSLVERVPYDFNGYERKWPIQEKSLDECLLDSRAPKSFRLAQSSPSRTPEQSAEDKEYVSHALDYIYDGKGPGRPIFPTGREHISSQPSRISEHFGTNLALEQAAATGDGFPPAQSPPSRTPSRQPYHEGSGAFVDNDMNG